MTREDLETVKEIIRNAPIQENVKDAMFNELDKIEINDCEEDDLK